ncbi:MAG: recombination protein RecR [Gammaproteobacteria bacterium]|nr:MAG: recombination protein RecR [Gammaproteobacteria bacterium]
MRQPARLEALLEALRCLPGVGAKSAQRMAFHLLSRDRAGGLRLAEALRAALEGLGECERCRNFAEEALCPLCADPRRDAELLCVVEQPADVLALEQAGEYRGLYFVLHGRLSPLDGIGPEELGLDRLAARLAQTPPRELILATGTTVEGEATAHHVAELAREAGVAVSRIAYGVPLGGELDLVDSHTLSLALNQRKAL